MVGVPGRSKGCRTCRRRKKGCDLQRPKCGQCVKSGIECGGYERDLTIVQYAPHGANVTTTTAESSSSAAAQNTPDLGPPIDPSLTDSTLLSAEAEAALIDKLWDIEFVKYTMAGPPSILDMSDWRLSVQEIYPRDPAVKAALLAVSLAHLSHLQENPQLLNDSLRYYLKALRETTRALTSLSRQTSDGVLAACKLLSVYEQLSAPGDKEDVRLKNFNWDQHVKGTLKILQIRGPANFQNDSAYRLFMDARHTGMILGVKARKASFLAERAWLTLPWNNRIKDLKQYLLDSGVQVPGVLEIFDVLRTKTGTTHEQRLLYRHVLALTDYLHMQLEKWYFHVSLVIAPSLMDQLKDGVPIDFPVEERALAFLMTIYWNSRLLIYATVIQVYQHVQTNPELAVWTVEDDQLVQAAQAAQARQRSSHPSTSNSSSTTTRNSTPIPYNVLPEDPPSMTSPPEPPSDVPPYATPDTYSRLIANSTAYFFQPSGIGFATTCAFSFPMGCALQYEAAAHPIATPELKTLRAAFSATGKGPLIQRFLLSQQAGAAQHVAPRFREAQRDRLASFEAARARAQAWWGAGGKDLGGYDVLGTNPWGDGDVDVDVDADEGCDADAPGEEDPLAAVLNPLEGIAGLDLPLQGLEMASRRTSIVSALSAGSGGMQVDMPVTTVAPEQTLLRRF